MPRGSNFGAPLSHRRRLCSSSRSTRRSGDSSRPSSRRLVLARVPRDENERQLEAAGVDDREQVVDARRDGALLPAGDHRALAPGALGELGLGEAGSQPRLADERPSLHRADSSPLEHTTCKETTTHISYTCSERSKRLSSQKRGRSEVLRRRGSFSPRSRRACRPSCSSGYASQPRSSDSARARSLRRPSTAC